MTKRKRHSQATTGHKPVQPTKLPPPMEAPELTLPEAYEQWTASGDKTAQEWVEINKPQGKHSGNN